MADNYLERKMEEYRSGRLNVRKTVSAVTRRQPSSSLIIPYPPMRALVICGELSSLVAETVRALRSVGMRVAFTCCDATGGRKLAETSGGRFYPPPMTDCAISDDLMTHWGDIDIIIEFRPFTACSAEYIRRLRIPGNITRPEVDAAHAARAILFFVHPDNIFLSHAMEKL